VLSTSRWAAPSLWRPQRLWRPPRSRPPAQRPTQRCSRPSQPRWSHSSRRRAGCALESQRVRPTRAARTAEALQPPPPLPRLLCMCSHPLIYTSCCLGARVAHRQRPAGGAPGPLLNVAAARSLVLSARYTSCRRRSRRCSDRGRQRRLARIGRRRQQCAPLGGARGPGIPRDVASRRRAPCRRCVANAIDLPPRHSSVRISRCAFCFVAWYSRLRPTLALVAPRRCASRRGLQLPGARLLTQASAPARANAVAVVAARSLVRAR
jgi:hypothetical protein